MPDLRQNSILEQKYDFWHSVQHFRNLFRFKNYVKICKKYIFQSFQYLLLALVISFKKLKVEWAIYENWLLLKLFDSMKSNCVSFGFGSTICKYWVHSPFQCSSLLLRRCCSSRASSAHPISVQLHAFWFFVVKSKRTKKSVRSHFSYF